MSKSFEDFRKAYCETPVEVTFDQFAKEGAFSSRLIEALESFGFKSFFFTPLSSADRDSFEASFLAAQDNEAKMQNLRGRLIAKVWCYKDGKLVGDPAYVGTFPAEMTVAMFDKVRELNGMDTESTDAVDEAGKD